MITESSATSAYDNFVFPLCERFPFEKLLCLGDNTSYLFVNIV